MNKLYILIGLVVVVGGGLIGFGVWQTNQPGQHDKVAQCLTDNGTKMYGAYWCSHCQAQKKLFGNSFKYVTYIECAAPGGQGQTQECADAKIEGYPTWEFGDKSRVSGEQSIEELAKKAGCTL